MELSKLALVEHHRVDITKNRRLAEAFRHVDAARRAWRKRIGTLTHPLKLLPDTDINSLCSEELREPFGHVCVFP